MVDKPFVLPVFIPHAGCHHRCVFCNQNCTTSQAEALPSSARIHDSISRYLSYRKDPRRFTEISFYGGNFLGLPADSIVKMLDACRPYIRRGQVQGIRFSTRPDTIDGNRLALLSGYPVTTVELGVQSMNNHVLNASQRGHTAQDAIAAVALLKKERYRLGLQMMVGLPGDTFELAMATGKSIADLQPDFVRIYPTLILKASRLAHWYAQGRYTPMDLDQAVAQVKTLYACFARRKIKVIRMGLQATEGLQCGRDVIAGPFHPAFGELVHSALWLDALRREIQVLPSNGGLLAVRANPKCISRIKGHKNSNLGILMQEFQFADIKVVADTRLPLDVIDLNGHPCHLIRSEK